MRMSSPSNITVTVIRRVSTANSMGQSQMTSRETLLTLSILSSYVQFPPGKIRAGHHLHCLILIVGTRCAAGEMTAGRHRHRHRHLPLALAGTTIDATTAGACGYG